MSDTTPETPTAGQETPAGRYELLDRGAYASLASQLAQAQGDVERLRQTIKGLRNLHEERFQEITRLELELAALRAERDSLKLDYYVQGERLAAEIEYRDRLKDGHEHLLRNAALLRAENKELREENEGLRATLQAVIDHAVEPSTANFAMMVPLQPIRAAIDAAKKP